jgi:hypothetical protein
VHVHFLFLRRRLYARECENPVRQAFSLNLNTRYRGVQLFDLVRREHNRSGADVLDHVRHLRRAGDWHDPRFLRQQPCKSNLTRSGLLPFGPLLNELYKIHVVLQVF